MVVAQLGEMLPFIRGNMEHKVVSILYPSPAWDAAMHNCNLAQRFIPLKVKPWYRLADRLDKITEAELSSKHVKTLEQRPQDARERGLTGKVI